MSLYQDWLDAKEAERKAVELRRFVEDQLAAQMQLDCQHEGSKTEKHDGYKIKVTQRLNRRVNGDMLQELAAENGLTEHLGSLFRWSPSIDAKAWKAADESITRPLLDAIITTESRPTFSIEKIED